VRARGNLPGSVDISPTPDGGGSELQKAKVSAGQFVKPAKYPASALDLADETIGHVAFPV
jgi:hypothetical protein